MYIHTYILNVCMCIKFLHCTCCLSNCLMSSSSRLVIHGSLSGPLFLTLRHFLTAARVYDLQWECQCACVGVCRCLTVFDAPFVVGFNVCAVLAMSLAFKFMHNVLYVRGIFVLDYGLNCHYSPLIFLLDAALSWTSASECAMLFLLEISWGITCRQTTMCT